MPTQRRSQRHIWTRKLAIAVQWFCRLDGTRARVRGHSARLRAAGPERLRIPSGAGTALLRSTSVSARRRPACSRGMVYSVYSVYRRLLPEEPSEHFHVFSHSVTGSWDLRPRESTFLGEPVRPVGSPLTALFGEMGYFLTFSKKWSCGLFGRAVTPPIASERPHYIFGVPSLLSEDFKPSEKIAFCALHFYIFASQCK